MKRGGGGGRRSPFPEFRALPGASRPTPTGKVVDVETGKVHSFIPPRLLPQLVWADEVEEEERRVEEAREREPREKEKVERERKWRERSS